MESSQSGAAGGAGSGDEQDLNDPKGKKKYHRHTARQIQFLERTFKDCPHPDEKQRQQLSRELGLEAKQIKFWFQNRRTQQKAQHERQDNCALRGENDKIRCDNISMAEALKNCICPRCVGPTTAAQEKYKEDERRQLRMENAKLKEKLERLMQAVPRFVGRPITQLLPLEPASVSSLDLSMGSFGSCQSGITGPSLDLDLLPGASSSLSALPYQSPVISDMDKTQMIETATSGMDQLLRLLQAGEPLWIKSLDGRDVLHVATYAAMYPRANPMNSPNAHIEASRESGTVLMNGGTLVEMFFDPNKWIDLFPTNVLNSRIIDVVSNGIAGERTGTLLMMYEEVQVLSPLVSTRDFYFLRYCQQLEHGVWLIADVSYDLSRQNQFPVPHAQKLPSGCLIQEMPDGSSKVTWVEHVEVEDKVVPHRLYRDLVFSGIAFGAQRRFATLQRMCERITCLMLTGNSARELEGVIPTPEGKQAVMKLSQRMINIFCRCISASTGQKWTTLSGTNDVGVCVTVQRSSDPGQPNSVVLSAASSIWLPASSETIFNFFMDEQSRQQWDILSNGPMQVISRVPTGSQPGNLVSILQNVNGDSMFELQETWMDSSGASMLVHSPVELQELNIAISGNDPSYIPLLPSGFVVLPDFPHADQIGTASSSSSAAGVGSLVTVVFQMLVHCLPNSKLNLESVNTINNLISNSVQRLKVAFNGGSS